MGYLRGLINLNPVLIPTDLSQYKQKYGTNITDAQRKGLLKFFKFLETMKLKTEWNGYPLALFRTNLSIAEYGSSRMGGRIKDLTNDEIIKAREKIENKKVQVYFTLLAYSGARHSHLYEALKEQRPIKHYGNGVIGIDVKNLSSGTKNESVFYFPAELENVLRNYKHPVSSDNLAKYIGASGTEDRPVNAASIRKWMYNTMLTGENRIETTAADHIQGRAPKTVGARHYADLDKIAAEGYAVILPKLRKAIPVPEWMQTADISKIIEVEKKPAKKKSSSRREKELKEKEKQRLKKIKEEQEKEKKVLEMLKDGKSNREIIAAVHMGKNKIKKIADENGIVRS